MASYRCGGGVEYLHRDPASCRRRRKGKSQVPRDSDPRKTTLARASSTYKRQTRPCVREAPHKNKTVTATQSWAPDGARHQELLTNWPSVAMWLWLWLFMALILTLLTLKAPLRTKATPFLHNTLRCYNSAADNFNTTIPKKTIPRKLRQNKKQ
jgi:hypothetical protein